MRLDASNSVPWPPYDAAILRRDIEPTHAFPAGLSEWADLEHAYRVTRKVIKDDGAIVDGSPSTGIKYLRGLYLPRGPSRIRRFVAAGHVMHRSRWKCTKGQADIFNGGSKNASQMMLQRSAELQSSISRLRAHSLNAFSIRPAE